MSAIVNYRDLLLQAASPRVLPVPIPEEVLQQLRRLKINASATTITDDAGALTPATITLTAVKDGTLSGAVTWTATGATITGAGDTVTVAASSLTGASATITASVTQGGKVHTAQINLSKVRPPKGVKIDPGLTTAFLGRAGGGIPTTPASITLTARLIGGLTGAVSWSVLYGSAFPSAGTGSTFTVTGNTVGGYSVTIRARVTEGGIHYDDQITLTRSGALSESDKVDLTTMVTGQLASGNVTGLGALALLSVVELNPSPGATVTVVGDLAATRIGAGQLAAGVVYAGNVNAHQVNAGSFLGKTFTGGIFVGGAFQTATSGERVVITGTTVTSYNAADGVTSKINDDGRSAFYGRGTKTGLEVISYNSSPALYCSAASSGPALEVAGPLKWGGQTVAPPSNSATRYLRDDGAWINPFGTTTPSAGSAAGYIVLPDGKRIPYHNP